MMTSLDVHHARVDLLSSADLHFRREVLDFDEADGHAWKTEGYRSKENDDSTVREAGIV